ncbi:hypothetical protein Syun_004008 [Stephania yunnanensis]|uniref:Uncharacterized protein n=1 Tax=Stephania yunnanensis TaxID=152371 RepID=A0AAP0Q4H1_9MAGN
MYLAPPCRIVPVLFCSQGTRYLLKLFCQKCKHGYVAFSSEDWEVASLMLQL